MSALPSEELDTALMPPLPSPRAHRGAFRPTSPADVLSVLLLEDSPADAELLTAMLEDELPDAALAVVTTLSAALPLLGDVDVVVTDLTLPDAEGLEALNGILAARRDLAVVVMTGQRDRELALRALACGAEDYLVKGSLDARGVARAVLFAVQRRQADLGVQHYERLSDSLLDAMESATCAVDRDGVVVAVNNAWHAFSVANGGAPDSCLGTDYFSVCLRTEGSDAAVARDVAAGLRAVLDGRWPRYERDYPCPGPQGERWFSLRINPLPEAGALLSHIEVTATKRAEQRLRHLALHDPLTGLPNRVLLTERLVAAQAAAGGGTVGVAFVDLDQFKRVNDSLGHQAGDELLRQVARNLGAGLRTGDTLARFAGDEFVVLWPGLHSESEVELLGSRLSEAMRTPVTLPTATLTVTASIGLALAHAGQSPDEVLLDADAAMYEAKRRGRGQVRSYSKDLRQGVLARLHVEQELRGAIQRDELVLHYQPVVDLVERRVCGVEALVRWQHPSGLRMPDTFIPMAEETGLVVPLGAWVLEQACRQLVSWSRQGYDLDLAVNLSARQISDPTLLATLRSALTSTGLPARRLLAEVTESTLLEDTEEARGIFAQIRALGARVAIDDFGTGYSSLLYLKRYPVGALKVDRQFVAGLGDERDDAIVASVVSLSRAVGATCIAEGVETAEQLRTLLALGCRQVQGYLLSRPVPAELLPQALARCDAVLARLPDASSAQG